MVRMADSSVPLMEGINKATRTGGWIRFNNARILSHVVAE